MDIRRLLVSIALGFEIETKLKYLYIFVKHLLIIMCFAQVGAGKVDRNQQGVDRNLYQAGRKIFLTRADQPISAGNSRR